ncbi:hypothetical protein [Geodermatophilus maliterrae]|uniref:Glycosyltransferase family 29 (Sialyltransferase) n=1 Tax=Geodermatophilus maliterrae TaxID=3162531 RepID=A0ABV3XC98_9ACTN
MSSVVAERWRADLRDLARTYAADPRVRTVAVVGNKPMTPDAERVAAIDGADLVVRVNGFRLDDAVDEATYGRRAHVVFFNRALRATPWFFAGYQDRLHLMVEPGRLHWEPEQVPSWWPADLGHLHVDNDDLTIPLSEDLGLDSRAEGLWSTTGTMAAWWARTTFPDAHVHLAGYSFVDDPHQTRWAHASGDDCIVGPEHRIALESRLMRRWAAAGSVTIWP